MSKYAEKNKKKPGELGRFSNDIYPKKNHGAKIVVFKLIEKYADKNRK